MSYVQGPEGLLEQRSGGSTAYPVPDAHGDVIALLDAEGGVDSRQAYDPWGAQLEGPALEMGWLGAQQRRSDPATGLVQMGARPYDPTLAGFIAEDPILGHLDVTATLNRYDYAWNNPLLYFDLTGYSVFGDVGSAIGNAASKAIRAGKTAVNTGREGAEWSWNKTSPIRGLPRKVAGEVVNTASQAPEFVSDRASAFWKAYGGTVTDTYFFAAGNLQNCRNGAAAGAASGFVLGSLVTVVGGTAGAVIGGVSGCAGLVGANEGIKALAG